MTPADTPPPVASAIASSSPTSAPLSLPSVKHTLLVNANANTASAVASPSSVVASFPHSSQPPLCSLFSLQMPLCSHLDLLTAATAAASMRSPWPDRTHLHGRRHLAAATAAASMRSPWDAPWPDRTPPPWPSPSSRRHRCCINVITMVRQNPPPWPSPSSRYFNSLARPFTPPCPSCSFPHSISVRLPLEISRDLTAMPYLEERDQILSLLTDHEDSPI
ncbi:hypothetical protein BT93_C2469 [Corymbia citriodora subsp. variegata]|nr:hypothetical protein BT93_C2469 [Corymbia citriodora subsp. variegata]